MEQYIFEVFIIKAVMIILISTHVGCGIEKFYGGLQHKDDDDIRKGSIRIVAGLSIIALIIVG